MPWEGQVRRWVVQHIANRRSDDVAAGVRVFPVGPGRESGIAARHEPCNIAHPEQHPHDIRSWAVLVLLEAEPAAHVEELVKRDPRPRISRLVPLRNRSRARSISDPADENADERIHHTLGHRPARECRVWPDAGPIALGNDPSALHHDDGARSSRVPRVRFLECSCNHCVQLRACMAGNARLRRRQSSAVDGFGGHFRIAMIFRQTGRREVVEFQRAAEALAIDGTALDAQRACSDGVRDGVDRRIDVLQDREIVHLKIGQDRRWSPLGDEHSRAEHFGFVGDADSQHRHQKPDGRSERTRERNSDCAENQSAYSARQSASR